MYSSSATSTVMPLRLKVTLWVFDIFSPVKEAPAPTRGTGASESSLALIALWPRNILTGGAADGALVGGLDALHLLVADSADHRNGHRRVRGLAFLVNFYLLAGITG